LFASAEAVSNAKVVFPTPPFIETNARMFPIVIT
jgi:hypothetical protein